MDKPKNDRINVLVSPALKRRFKAAVEKRHDTISKVLRKMMIRYIAKTAKQTYESKQKAKKPTLLRIKRNSANPIHGKSAESKS